MTEAGRMVAVRQELELAGEELRAAEMLLTGALARVALTRIYFAAFHTIRALLYAQNLEPTSHRAVRDK